MKTIVPLLLLFSLTTPLFANCLPSMPSCPRQCDTNTCCNRMGGISYCDSSAGRYVCNNGFYSSCYCTRHAIMSLQDVQGCCLWQGGVKAVTPEHVVVCNDGGISEECSILNAKEAIVVY